MIKFFVILVAMVGLSAVQAMSCSCARGGSAADDLQKAKAVFAGTVLEVVRPQGAWGKKAVRLKVLKNWKGAENAQEMVVHTSAMSAACGSQFDVGKNYVVYAYLNKDDKLETNLCTRTKLLSRTSSPR